MYKCLTHPWFQSHQGNIYDGSRGLPWPLYLKINRWFLEDGSPECIFGAAFAKTTMNLACRGDNTGQICTKHLEWENDCFGIPFAHEKCHQARKDTSKRLPRHCYSNPLDQQADFSSALFHYFVMYPDVLADPEGQLFQGGAASVTKSFSRALKKIVTAHVTGIEQNYNIKVCDISIHSYRKCAHTRLNCGTTDGPSGAAASIRGGHSLGSIRNIYVQQEKASDYYYGRILSGLLVNDPKFAVSYPDFIPIDVESSFTGAGLLIEQVEQDVLRVRKDVDSALESIFGREILDNFKTIHVFLRIGLASHLKHLAEIERYLPYDAKIRQTPLFTNPEVEKLQDHVRIAMPWEDHYIFSRSSQAVCLHMYLCLLRSEG